MGLYVLKPKSEYGSHSIGHGCWCFDGWLSNKSEEELGIQLMAHALEPISETEYARLYLRGYRHYDTLVGEA